MRCVWLTDDKKSTRMNNPMTKNALKPEIMGTRAGYVIRYACPACASENIVITKTAKDHFKETHFASCKKCGERLTILTPSAHHMLKSSPVYAYPGKNIS
jgi:transcription elongation factor Elf1